MQITLDALSPSTIAIAVFSLAFFFYLNRPKSDWPRAPTWPLIGSIPFILRHKGLNSTTARDEMGVPVYRVKAGSGPEILIIKTVAAAQAFEKHETEMAEKWRPSARSKELGLHDNFLPTEDTSPEMLAKRKAIVMGVQSMLSTSSKAKDSGLDRSCEQLASDIDEKLGRPLDQPAVIDLLGPCVAVMGVSLSFGLRLKKDTAEAEIALRLVHGLTSLLGMVGTDDLFTIFPFLAYLLPFVARSQAKAALTLRNTGKADRQKLIEAARQQVEKHGVDSLDPSTLRWIWSDPKHQGLSDETAAGSVEGALAGSTDTSTHSLACIVACLAAWPEWQQILCDDLLQNGLGKDDVNAETIREQTKTFLPFVREVLRLFGSFQLTQRTASADFIVDDKRVYKGSKILFDRLSINRDPDSYGADADEFNPRRYYERKPPSYLKYGHGSFGAGRRRCPGSDLAETFLTVALAHIVLRYKIDFVEEGPMGLAALKPSQFGVLSAFLHRPIRFAPV